MSSWQTKRSNTSGVLWHYLSTLSQVNKGVILPDGLAEELSPSNPSYPAYIGALSPQVLLASPRLLTSEVTPIQLDLTGFLMVPVVGIPELLINLS